MRTACNQAHCAGNTVLRVTDQGGPRAGPITSRAPLPGGNPAIDQVHIGPDVIAGVTLAALGIPEVMGYANIAGMPVITGLYTILIPFRRDAIRDGRTVESWIDDDHILAS